MNIVKTMGEEIFSFIKLTTDLPSNYEDGYMPMLDIQSKVLNNIITYNFLRKQ